MIFTAKVQAEELLGGFHIIIIQWVNKDSLVKHYLIYVGMEKDATAKAALRYGHVMWREQCAGQNNKQEDNRQVRTIHKGQWLLLELHVYKGVTKGH